MKYDCYFVVNLIFKLSKIGFRQFYTTHVYLRISVCIKYKLSYRIML